MLSSSIDFFRFLTFILCATAVSAVVAAQDKAVSRPPVPPETRGTDPEARTPTAGENQLVNGGFEQNGGPGTVPVGWEADDELFGYFGWIAPRAERRIGDLWPRTGRFMIGLDSEQMGIDSNGQDYDTPRAAIRQTVKLPGGARGVFSIYYNDIGSTGLAYISVIHLAYTIDSTDIGMIHMPQKREPQGMLVKGEPGVWSRPFHRVSQKLPGSHTSTGDWTLASIPVTVPNGSKAEVTVWIGIFDNQNSTEVGYWRIDDASLRLEPALPVPSPSSRPAAQ